MKTARLLKRILLLQLLMLALFSVSRSSYIYLFAVDNFSQNHFLELLAALFFGLRLDLSVLGYIFVLPLLLAMIFQFTNSQQFTPYLIRFLRWYFFIIYSTFLLIILADIAFYSYFGDHINISVFGVFDDDIVALFAIARKNYNLPAVILCTVSGIFCLYIVVNRILHFKDQGIKICWKKIWVINVYILLVFLAFCAIRGTFGRFPINHMVPDMSTDIFINKLASNSVFSLRYAIKHYKISKSGKYDLIKQAGYKGRIAQAFSDLTNKQLNSEATSNDLIQTLQHATDRNLILEQQPPHVVVVMVESFGLPITKYQSEKFDILGSLKKHFSDDILFTSVLSASNKTIDSLEPFLLNIAARPLSTPIGQSEYLNISFKQAAAKVYQSKGYETSFVYGGDLSWRNIGAFFKRQGFLHVEGKTHILKSLKLDKNDSTTHDWGVFDQFSYQYVLNKLQKATTPQFVFLLTTNNHPPHRLQPEYSSASLVWPEELKKSLTGNKKLAKKRLLDYQYALDMAGIFMDEIKSTVLGNNTVVTITADNNTIEGIMYYSDPLTNGSSIPFYLYLPPQLRVKEPNTSTPGSHKDIFPTLYNLTLSNAEYISVGTDLFDNSILHCGFNDSGAIVSPAGAFQWKKPENDIQMECNKHYNAALAVTEYLIRSHTSN